MPISGAVTLRDLAAQDGKSHISSSASPAGEKDGTASTNCSRCLETWGCQTCWHISRRTAPSTRTSPSMTGVGLCSAGSCHEPEDWGFTRARQKMAA